MYSTLLPDSSLDEGKGIAVNADGCAFVAGTERLPVNLYSDCFVAKLSSFGDSLVGLDRLIGTAIDWAVDIELDRLSQAYVMGNTESWDFPTENPFQSYQGDLDVFVAKIADISTGLDQPDDPELPYRFELSQNYPNPFNPMTVIKYSVPSRSLVVVEVFDILGRKVKTLVNGTKPAGHHEVVWTGVNSAGETVASAVYLYRIKAGSFVESRKMLLLK